MVAAGPSSRARARAGTRAGTRARAGALRARAGGLSRPLTTSPLLLPLSYLSRARALCGSTMRTARTAGRGKGGGSDLKGTTTAMDETEREQRDDALAALLFRGVQPQKAQQLIELEEATPDRIIAACHRWDGDHIGAGALVYRIQHGDFRGPEPDARELRQQRLRETFDAVIARFPIGTAIGLHAK